MNKGTPIDRVDYVTAERDRFRKRLEELRGAQPYAEQLIQEAEKELEKAQSTYSATFKNHLEGKSAPKPVGVEFAECSTHGSYDTALGCKSCKKI